MANYEAIRTLLGLRSPSNMTGGDPYVARRRADIYSGIDDMVPGGDSAEIRAAQHELGRRGVSVSRDAIREDPMARLRQTLGIGAIKHGQEVERAEVAPRVAGEYNLREREAANRGALDVERERGRSAMSRAELENENLRTILGLGVTPSRISRGGVSISTDTDDDTSLPPTQGQTKALQTARSAYGGPMSRFARWSGIGEGGKQDYLNALNDVLVRSGSYDMIAGAAKEAQQIGMSAAEAIAEAEAQGVTLNPYEQEYLKVILGE